MVLMKLLPHDENHDRKIMIVEYNQETTLNFRQFSLLQIIVTFYENLRAMKIVRRSSLSDDFFFYRSFSILPERGLNIAVW